MSLELKSPCKINLLLNILGKREDGFHELETVMHPVAYYDLLNFEMAGNNVQLTCSDATLATDSKNLVYRAADAFLKRAGIGQGVRIHLEKRIPHAAGLGGGSGNAATTLLALNQLFAFAFSENELTEIAASLGSDVPFFLQNCPALATGRGEQIHALDSFPALDGLYILLVHPGFGISTPWSYRELSKFPDALHGRRGRAEKLISLLQNGPLEMAAPEFYNSLEAPALKKFPLLALIQEFFRSQGALVAMMSGSGSATFALVRGKSAAETMLERFRVKFGEKFWTTIVPLSE
ncbi:MAG: 4-(cytidine 5'-diphospho)-2-C-methyl-D-erythritol kinase [Verrucomicrobiota bacterium]